MTDLRYILSLILFCSFTGIALAQNKNTDANVFGDVKSEATGEHVPFASVFIEGTNTGTTTDHTGHYMMIDLPAGTHVLVARAMGYQEAKDTIKAVEGQSVEVNFVLREKQMTVDEVVITGTKTFKRQTESPVIVNVIDSRAINMVQACDVAEGLRFQPGLRVETDCQTCNYTQLRMNGLGGGYSQILINGRPIFSPLMGLYGMEQIPSNMIDRIEVVRGGGSALYGSSAIGGTVNIITKIPNEEDYNVSFTTQRINAGANDVVFTGNASTLTEKRNAGASFFVSRRLREAYDHNQDNFSELPELKENSFGTNLYYQPTLNQKLEVTFTSLNEYRYGGEMTDKPAHLAFQSEERTHNVLMGGIDYQLNFNQNKSSFIAYTAGQYTDREHYTGIFPDEPLAIEEHLANPPYGTSENTTLQAGIQVNHRLMDFLGGSNVITIGAEYVFDDIYDIIRAYNYITDQETKNAGGFFQSDWQVFSQTNLLAGVRIDKHNLVDQPIVSPRFSLLQQVRDYTQLRLTWGTGFRAPQAFDADMHIAFAGGGVSRIELAEDLTHERSYSLSGSVNFDKPSETFIYGFTLEGFRTRLNDAFYLFPVGKDQFGELFEKRNGPGATVQGGTIELRANYNRIVQLETGFTLQTSRYQQPVENIEGLEPKREFLRTPNEYGYLTLLVMPGERFNASVSTVYTGPMLITHYAGAPGQTVDEYVNTPSFTELSFKVGYTIPLESVGSGLEVYSGVKNLTNAYQDDFDSGKNRDSNYIYGPSAPRTVYIGLSLKRM